jgi:O-methyltransferase
MLDLRLHRLYRKYSPYTMIPEPVFVDNLRLVRDYAPSSGAVVECGVWRGGMSAAVAQLLGPSRDYYLFDSFEGLPPAKAIDGAAAQAWQSDTSSPAYFDNCRAEMEHAQRAMALSGAQRTHIVKGWFSDTLQSFPADQRIAVLRLDGDWYESTMQCLTQLFPRVSAEGLIIFDDYYAWDGCALAVHDYLSRMRLPCRLRQSKHGVCYTVNAAPVHAAE